MSYATTQPLIGTAPQGGRSLKRILFRHELAFLALVALAALLGLAGAAAGHLHAGDSARVTRQLLQAGALATRLEQATRSMTHAVAMQDPSARQRLEGLVAMIEERFAALRAAAAAPEEVQAVDAWRAAWQGLSDGLAAMTAGGPAQREGARIRLLGEPFRAAVIEPLGLRFAALRAVLHARQQRLDEQLAGRLQAAPWILLLTLALAALLIVRARGLLRRELARPLDRLMAAVVRIRAGELPDGGGFEGASELRLLDRSLGELAAGLHESRRRLAERERDAALGALVPVVAHNIRNPLAGIRATAQLLDAGSDRDEILECRAAVIETVDRLERWVGSLLAYLTPVVPERVPVDLATLLDALLELCRHRIEGQRLKLLRRGEDARPCIVIGSQALLEQALNGLLVNAIDASPPGGELEIGLYRDADRATIAIADRGPGLAFDPDPGELTRGPTTKPRGTGLGIPFAFKVMQSHGGALRFIAGRDGGTRAVVELPLDR